MQQSLDAQIERLTALRQVNPLVREEEIVHLQHVRQQAELYLHKARVRFDAIRLIVVNHD